MIQRANLFSCGTIHVNSTKKYTATVCKIHYMHVQHISTQWGCVCMCVCVCKGSMRSNYVFIASLLSQQLLLSHQLKVIRASQQRSSMCMELFP